MTRHSKNYSHIWDNVMGTSNHHHYRSTACDSTGSSVSIVDYSRQEITVVSGGKANRKEQTHRCPQVMSKKKQYEKVILEAEKRISERRDDERKGFVTGFERECAQQPRQLAPWTYRAEPKQNYDSHVASRAFDEYTRRLAARKKKYEEQSALAEAEKHKEQKSRKRVTIDESTLEIVHDNGSPRASRGVKFNDDAKIDGYCKTITTAVVETNAEDVKIQKMTMPEPPKKQPGFYGTLEAEKCAERVAGHISAATEHLERLHFVAEAVLPESGLHLKKLQEIADDIRDFNSQMRSHRAKLPKALGVNHVAHFVITDTDRQ